MVTFVVLLGVVCASALSGFATWAFLQKRRGIWAVTCDLRRCLVLIGPEQNDPACVEQRRALKPLLMRVRHIGMNVIELYGGMTPRRNGRPLEWLDNGALRRALKVNQGFHLICLDDESEIILRSHRPVSESALSEFIAMEEPIALPAPDAAPEVTATAAATAAPAPQPAKPAQAAPDMAAHEQHEPEPETTVHVSVARSASASEPQTSWGRVGVLR